MLSILFGIILLLCVLDIVYYLKKIDTKLELLLKERKEEIK